MRILVTGGAGFIGSAVIRHLIEHTEHEVINIDKLTYAGNLASLSSVESHPNYQFIQCCINDTQAVQKIFEDLRPDAIMHLAAESHVDRSIDHPQEFLNTNIMGTFNLLNVSLAYWKKLSLSRKEVFRFHHVSTDEVYGDLEDSDDYFTEETPYAPSSPYSASKAASDHLVRAWGKTYGLPVVLTKSSNNYGPYQFPEKFIPHMILNALSGKPLPIYGDGQQIRDWLFVDDHAKALTQVIENGKVGETYNIGGHNEKNNIDVVHMICELLEKYAVDKKPPNLDYFSDLITFVEDRPGHDRRYAIDASKIEKELGWTPLETFESGLEKTMKWYLTHESWWEEILSGNYQPQRIGNKA